MAEKKLFKICKGCGRNVMLSAAVCPDCGARVPAQSASRALKITGGVIAVLIFVALLNPSDEDSLNDGSATTAGVSDLKGVVQHQVTLDYRWSKVAFDSIMEATFTVKNDSSQDLKDIKIECLHYAESGTKIDRNSQTLYQVFPSGTKTVVRDVNMGFIHSQATDSSCRISDFELN